MAEAKAIARVLGLRPHIWGRGADRPEASGRVVGVYAVGVGARALADEPVTAGIGGGIILAGLGGALEPSLKVGDVVIEGMDAAGWPGVRCAAMHTAAQIACTPADKAALRQSSGAWVVEMEGEAVRRLARSLGVRFVHVRAISDAADEALDPRVLGLIDPFGRARLGVLAGALARRPVLLKDLLRLARNAHVAGQRLADVVGRVVEEVAAVECIETEKGRDG